MGIEVKTDREAMIELSGKIDNQNYKMDNLAEAMERFADALEKLEVTKFGSLEGRVDKLEKLANEWSGGYKLLFIIGLILGLITSFILIYNFFAHGK